MSALNYVNMEKIARSVPHRHGMVRDWSPIDTHVYSHLHVLPYVDMSMQRDNYLTWQFQQTDDSARWTFLKPTVDPELCHQWCVYLPSSDLACPSENPPVQIRNTSMVVVFQPAPGITRGYTEK